MANFNYFQNRIHSEYKDVGQIDDERLKMNDLLDTADLELEVKDRLHDQLVWLKFQIDYFYLGGDVQLLIDDYNWVVDSFHEEFEEGGEEFGLLSE